MTESWQKSVNRITGKRVETKTQIQNRIPLGFYKGSTFPIMGMPETSQFESKEELTK